MSSLEPSWPRPPPPKDGRRLGVLRGGGRYVFILATVVAVCTAGYLLIGSVADWAASKISDALESELFASLGEEQEGWHAAARNGRERRAERLFERLITQRRDLRQLAYALFFIDDDDANAFALPGGSVAVTTGLLDLVVGEVGLAMVLAHELGHLEHRHSLQAVGRSLLMSMALKLIFGDNAVVDLAVEMTTTPHSRESELEADAFGLKTVHAVFGTTKGALEFFQKIEDEQDGALPSARLLSLVSTHPYTPERIKRLKDLQKKLLPTTPRKLKRTRAP